MAINISGLKPYRDYSEHDVLNIFATTGILEKGTLVSIASAVGNTNVFQTTGTPPATPYQTVSTAFGNAPSYAYVTRGSVAWTVGKATSATSSTGVQTAATIGMLLYDVATTNSFGEDYRYRPAYERHEKQIALVGESVPIVKRGTFMTNNFSGTPTAGSGFTASNGKFLVGPYNKGVSLGAILTSADADNYALVALDCL